MAETEALTTAPEEVERSRRVQAVAAPIAANNPAGEDVTYDDDFQRVKMEVDKLASAAAGGVDFELIIELAERVLTTKSKDLRAATFLAMGLTRSQGLAGAAEGVAAIRTLVETFWEDLYPPTRRMRARRNALQALSDRLKEWVVEHKPAEADREMLEQAHADMKALQAFVLEVMGEDAPAVSGLTQAFATVLRKVPKPEPEPEPPPEATTQESTSGRSTETTGPPRSAAGGNVASQEFRSTKEAESVVFKATSFLLDEDKTNPVPYQLARAVRWGALRQEPPHQGSETMLPPPVEQRRTYLSGLLERREHVTLITEVEVTFRELPFWLDLQRYAVSAMDGLGEAYVGARDAILYEMAVLLQRFPGLTSLRFNDGTPFADPATQAWIEMRVAPLCQQEEGGKTASAHADDDGGVLHEQYQEARQKLGSNDLSGALALLQDGAVQDRSTRDGFRRRLYVAILCIKGGEAAVARPMLERLSEMIETHRLAEWDPQLALETWTNLYVCYSTLAARGAGDHEASAPLKEHARQVFDRICALDAGRALELTQDAA